VAQARTARLQVSVVAAVVAPGSSKAPRHCSAQTSRPRPRHSEPPREPSRPRPLHGRTPTQHEIAALDDDVRPDGTGLPPGRGRGGAGAPRYARRGASCQGATGRDGPFDVLVGVAPATSCKLCPHATTLYDYPHRAMPWAQPGSLSPDEVYSLVAWLLH